MNKDSYIKYAVVNVEKFRSSAILSAVVDHSLLITLLLCFHLIFCIVNLYLPLTFPTTCWVCLVLFLQDVSQLRPTLITVMFQMACKVTSYNLLQPLRWWIQPDTSARSHASQRVHKNSLSSLNHWKPEEGGCSLRIC